MQEDIHLHVIRGDSAPAAPDGVPGPLRLLEAIEERCGRREFWPEATQRELAAQLQTTDRSVRVWSDVLEAAGVAAWRPRGGGRASTCYLLQTGAVARRAVENALVGGPMWRRGRPADASGHRSDASGHASGQHNADSGDASGQGRTLPVTPAYTLSSSSSSHLPEAEALPVADRDEIGSIPRPDIRLFPQPSPGITLPGRLLQMGIDPEDTLVIALLGVSEDVREAALLRAFEKRARTPRYVLRCLESVRLLAMAPQLTATVPSEPSEPAPPDELAEVEPPVLDADWLAAEGDALTDALFGALGWEA